MQTYSNLVMIIGGLDVEDELAKNNITRCTVSHSKLPEIIFSASSPIYFRLLGRPKIFYSDYINKDLEKFKDLILNNTLAKKVFIYFNNTANTAGILSALKMKKLL